MKVMYTCDDNYVWLMGISVISLFENNKEMDEISVYLLGEKISSKNKLQLKEIGKKYQRTINVIDVPKLNIPPSLVSSRWPLSAFTRLFSGVILPNDIDRILYLDCDTIITGDISELEYIDFNGNIVMGVKDSISGAYKKNIGLNENDLYINAGVILFNIEILRNSNITMRIEEYMNEYVNFINYADQDILNGMFKGKIGILKPKYDVMTIDVVHSYEEIQTLRRPTNFYSKDEFTDARENPAIIHYTTNMRIVRPWFVNTNHPYAGEFKMYMELSPWKNKELKVMTFNSMESKVIGTLLHLPKFISYKALGIIHSELKPMYIRMKAKK